MDDRYGKALKKYQDTYELLDPWRKGIKVRDEQIDQLRDQAKFRNTRAGHCINTLLNTHK